jgi:NAD(P)-dependent dehydrogenase (short-subunit alcohol dehydrogenase family)
MSGTGQRDDTILGAIRLERWAASDWNDARNMLGIPGRLRRNPQIQTAINSWIRLIKSGASRDVRPHAADVSKIDDIARVFDRVERDLGEPNLVVFNAGAFRHGNVVDLDPADFEACWRIGCYAGFLVGQAAARRMAARRTGTIILRVRLLRFVEVPASST